MIASIKHPRPKRVKMTHPRRCSAGISGIHEPYPKTDDLGSKLMLASITRLLPSPQVAANQLGPTTQVPASMRPIFQPITRGYLEVRNCNMQP